MRGETLEGCEGGVGVGGRTTFNRWEGGGNTGGVGGETLEGGEGGENTRRVVETLEGGGGGRGKHWREEGGTLEGWEEGGNTGERGGRGNTRGV